MVAVGSVKFRTPHSGLVLGPSDHRGVLANDYPTQFAATARKGFQVQGTPCFGGCAVYLQYVLINWGGGFGGSVDRHI